MILKGVFQILELFMGEGPYYNILHIQSRGADGIRISATDGHMIICADFAQLSISFYDEFTIEFPQISGDVVGLSKFDNLLYFALSGGGVATTKITNRSFPDQNKIFDRQLPDTLPTRVMVDVSKLTIILKALEFFAPDDLELWTYGAKQPIIFTGKNFKIALMGRRS